MGAVPCHVLLFFVLATCTCYCETTECSDCTVRPHLPCKRDEKQDLHSVCALDLSPQELWPGKPQNFHVTSIKQGEKLKLNISWSIPADASFRNIKGFRVSLTTMSGLNVNHGRCITYNLTQAVWQYPHDLDSLVYFHDTCEEVNPDTKYHVQVYSLPLPSITHDQYAQVTYTTPSETVCGDLKVPVTVEPNTNLCQVTVVITSFGPDYCKFTHFQVDLVIDHISNPLVNSTIIKKPENSTTFTGLKPDTYRIMVRPKNNQHSCAPYTYCRTSKSDAFKIYGNGECIPVTVVTTVSTEQPSNILAIILPCIIGSAIAIALAISVVYLISKRERQPGLPGKGKGEYEVAPLEQHVLIVNEISVLLLYSKDMIRLDVDFHMEAVHRLAEYLKAHCRCNVSLVDWETDQIFQHGFMEWLLQKLDSVEIVIIVHSEGGYKRYKADQNQKRYSEDVDQAPVKDMFIDAVKYIQANFYNKERGKYLHVHFEYTSSDYIIDIFKDNPNYPLMKTINSLFLRLHKKSEHMPGIKTSTYKINEKDYKNTTEGQQLACAISKASEFIKKHPAWFPELYGILEDNHRRSDTTETSISITNDSGISLDEKQLSEIRIQNEAKSKEISPIHIDTDVPGNIDVHLFPPQKISAEYVNRLNSGNPMFSRNEHRNPGHTEKADTVKKRKAKRPLVPLNTDVPSDLDIHLIPTSEFSNLYYADGGHPVVGEISPSPAYYRGESSDSYNELGSFEGSVSLVSTPQSVETPLGLRPLNGSDILPYIHRPESWESSSQFIPPDLVPPTLPDDPSSVSISDFQRRLQMINSDSSESLNFAADLLPNNISHV